jgi:hypothetical protein
MLLLPLEFGWRLNLGSLPALTPFLRLVPFVSYPYNGTFLPQSMLQLGVYFPLTSLLPLGSETKR